MPKKNKPVSIFIAVTKKTKRDFERLAKRNGLFAYEMFEKLVDEEDKRVRGK